ncbi:putative flavin-containing polyamine oxidase [Calycina marina]|uniref:Amine oxidase n=1 Tax=Calycina marina TaxID=1763456 RepID=A0A9P8CFS9_9HELO|nr:putative flavin-containing polyamine oxidase [Calycina marina]
MVALISKALAVGAVLHLASATPRPLHPRGNSTQCRKTSVVVLGAGMAGIAAAQSMNNESMTDFIIVDVNSYIGGRVAHTTFGKDADGNPYTVELGANWIQGLGSDGGPENPIWTLAKKYKLTNTYSDYDSIITYDETGPVNYTDLLNVDFEDAYATVEQDAGYLLTENLHDRSYRTALSLAGWKPKKDMLKQAVEWWEFDWEYSYSPDLSSETWSIVNYNTTFYQYSDENNYVFDSRGYNAFIEGEAYTFLSPNDSRLLLNTNVTSIDYSSNNSITITMSDDSCIVADYAICTFSLGVLQNDVVEFTPKLPDWKQEGIEGMQMGTYTKIFLQFPPDQQFWDANTQFFLYADPYERGWYPVWQSLSAPGFLPGSGILFATVVYTESYRAEQQSDDITKAEVMAVLKNMFGDYIPDPIDFMYPRWSTEPWAYGSYSNWPPGMSIETHQNLRANVGPLYFAGEATSTEYYGFLQGAFFEGQEVGSKLAQCIKGNLTECRKEKSYEAIKGTTNMEDLTPTNGWTVSSMEVYGFD